MPPIFKALASISVWVLFIVGCVNILTSFIGWATGGFGIANWQSGATFLAIGIVSIILSVIAMRLRKMLE